MKINTNSIPSFLKSSEKLDIECDQKTNIEQSIIHLEELLDSMSLKDRLTTNLVNKYKQIDFKSTKAILAIVIASIALFVIIILILEYILECNKTSVTIMSIVFGVLSLIPFIILLLILLAIIRFKQEPTTCIAIAQEDEPKKDDAAQYIYSLPKVLIRTKDYKYTKENPAKTIVDDIYTRSKTLVASIEVMIDNYPTCSKVDPAVLKSVGDDINQAMKTSELVASYNKLLQTYTLYKTELYSSFNDSLDILRILSYTQSLYAAASIIEGNAEQEGKEDLAISVLGSLLSSFNINLDDSQKSSNARVRASELISSLMSQAQIAIHNCSNKVQEFFKKHTNESMILYSLYSNHGGYPEYLKVLRECIYKQMLEAIPPLKEQLITLERELYKFKD